MLQALLYPLADQWIVFNVLKYITFRTVAGLLTAMVLYFSLNHWQIELLKRLQIKQSIREEGPKHHQVKAGTPTMGGLLIWFCVFFSTLLWMDIRNVTVWVTVGLYSGFAFIGFWDDRRKIKYGSNLGLKGRHKFLMQLFAALMVVLLYFELFPADTRLSFPFFKSLLPDLGWWYLPFSLFVIVGASNAVNLTDGLDGLATGPSILAFGTLGVLAYFAGHVGIASYLQIPYILGSGELAVFSGVVCGALVGFLWFNSYPAEIFMGDVGSLPLGAAMGFIALVTKNELLLVLIGGIFVLEAVSVITQVVSFKISGRRIFQMAPIHHHFELKGWQEPKVIVRFWIISLILCLVALSTLKLR
ncbi:MAG: phospho-N-acetylmuramoyl-pentapeptide-transferase [Deltaproteobacteria bacterium]|nr:phospho-N-acetylmuramoyl-pentapeptide-transferase [Deltaproteobacteria bacterium]